MSRRTTSGEPNGEPNGEPTPAVPSAPPKRKFDVCIGGMTFQKRCTAQEMQTVLETTEGTGVVLLLDGFRFVMQSNPS